MIDVSRLDDDELDELRRKVLAGLDAHRTLLAAIQAEVDRRHPFPAPHRVKRIHVA